MLTWNVWIWYPFFLFPCNQMTHKSCQANARNCFSLLSYVCISPSILVDVQNWRMGKHLSGHFLLLLYVWEKEGGLRNTVLSWSHQITLRSVNSWICDFRTPNLHPELSLQCHLTRLTYGYWSFTPPLSKEEHGETIDMVFFEASLWRHSSDPQVLIPHLYYSS